MTPTQSGPWVNWGRSQAGLGLAVRCSRARTPVLPSRAALSKCLPLSASSHPNFTMWGPRSVRRQSTQGPPALPNAQDGPLTCDEDERGQAGEGGHVDDQAV